MPAAFARQDGALWLERVPLARIAACYGTPFYCYSSAALTAAYQELAEACAAFAPLICYAVKANSNLAVIRHFAALGAGADVVSGGELQRARTAGVPADKIVFSGVGKSPAELRQAAAAGIHQFNVESLPELAALGELATALGQRLPVALRLNPDVDPRTHAKIATGGGATKFGISLTQLDAVLALLRQQPLLDCCGVTVHIGSQLLDLAPFDQAFSIIARVIQDLRAQGLALRRVDLGGGLGIQYADTAPPALSAYAALIMQHFGKLDLAISLEPGRKLVGAAGLLVSAVLYAKQGAERNFLVIDAAMNDLMRPALYDAWHDIIPVQAQADAALTPWDVVGPVCETSDLFGEGRLLPPLAPGDLVAITCAGAYGASMASTYNSRALVPEFMVKDDCFGLIRRPIPPDEQMGWDVPPVWCR